MDWIAQQLQELAVCSRQFRYDGFHIFALKLNYERLFPLEDQAFAILKLSFAENPDESNFLRAYASYLIGMHYESLDQCTDAITYFDAAADLCQSAPGEARAEKVKDFEKDADEGGPHLNSYGEMPKTSVGEVLDKIQGDASFRKQRAVYSQGGGMPKLSGSIFDVLEKIKQDKLWDRPEAKEAFLQACAEGSDPFLRQPGMALETWEAFQSAFRGEYIRGKMAPTINSDVLAKVKALPEVDKTFLVFENEKKSNGNGSYVTFQVFEVNLEGFHAGKHNKVFRPVVTHLICYRRCPRPKNLLSAFVVACLDPQDKSLERPKKLLFQSEEDAIHQQTITFLSMMGCSDVSAADPALLELLEETKGILIYKEMARHLEDPQPHIYDHIHNISCGGCQLLGPTLKKCECGKAYYCGGTCQRSHWQEHKAAHIAAMAIASSSSEKGDNSSESSSVAEDDGSQSSSESSMERVD